MDETQFPLLIGGDNAALPADLKYQNAALDRRRKVAEQMLLRGTNPQQPIQHWTQGLAMLGNAYFGRKGMEDADAQQNEMMTKNAERRQSITNELLGMMTPKPAEQIPITSGDESVVLNREPVPVDPQVKRQAITKAMFDQDPSVSQAGQKMFAMMSADEQKAAMIEAKKEQQKADLEARKERQQMDAQARLERQREHDATLKAMKAASGGNQAVTVATIADPTDPNKALVIDARSGRVLGGSPKQTEIGRLETKRQFNAQGTRAAISEARDILSGITRDSEGNPVSGGQLPTQSGMGSLADKAGAFIGVATPGSNQADKLRVVGGSLVQKVPRFEGPQSDNDTKLYKQMAGDIANETIPIPRRLAALDSVEKIYAGYEDGTRGRIVPEGEKSPTVQPKQTSSETPPPGAVRRKQ